MMTALADYCILSHGWRRVVLVLVAGGLAALSMPPLFALPALFVSLPLLVWCLDGAERRTGWGRLFGPAFHIGFFFGLGYFLVAVHWIGGAFFVEGGWAVWAMPFALLALAALLAVFWGLGTALAHLFWSDGALRLVALGLGLTLAEFARGHLFSGFPFDLLGYALTANEQMMQFASIVGVYGLTALVVPLAASPALIWPADDRALPARLAPFFAALLVLAGQIGYGQYRLAVTEVTPRDDVRMRLVQPAIPQAIKWQAESREFVLDRLLTVSETRLTPQDPGLEGVTHLVWPESALPFFLADYPDALARIARLLPEDTLLLTGAPREEPLPGAGGTGTAPAYNSILAIDAAGEVIRSYDKTHLVPFGEYLPFGDFWRQLGLSQFVPGIDGWTAGEARRAFGVPGTPAFLPLICYEAIFSGALGGALEEAEFILNVTNDGWFDGTVGPAQHFHHARLRAVEHGISLVRVANTGITALVDPLGRVTARLAPGEMGVIDVVPDTRLAATVFSRAGHWPLAAAGGLALLALLFSALRRGRKNRLMAI